MNSNHPNQKVSMTQNAGKKEKINPYPSYAPRLWHGLRTHQWWGLLARNRFRLSFSKLHIAAGVTLTTPFNDLLSLVQEVVFGRAIRNTSLVDDPIFVLGHWRSGTTLMHELLRLDDRFASPGTYQCFAPWHFLITEKLMAKFGGFLLPELRPMDNMRVNWLSPQEDEFALLALGAATPYERIAFPRHGIPHQDSLASSTFDPNKLAVWKKKIDWFFQAVTYREGKQLIIKSPPHTGRLRILAEMYPNAKFIHMIRDPRKLYPSTVRLWRSLDEVQSLQAGHNEEELHRFVVESLNRMYDSFEIDRKSIPADRIIDIHYENLVASPVETLRTIYSHFRLTEFDSIAGKVLERQQNEKDYQTNQHKIDERVEQIIVNDWHAYAKRYGYLSGNHLAT
jgi:omega-hydroxy-beta-dihydromenaquinone-9 sulfotransferase